MDGGMVGGVLVVLALVLIPLVSAAMRAPKEQARRDDAAEQRLRADLRAMWDDPDRGR